MDLNAVDVDSFFAVPVTWWDVVLAIISILAGWILSRFARKGVTSLLTRIPHFPSTLVIFTARFTQYVILLLGVGVALAVLGANVQPLLATMLIVGLIVVLVLRGVADNFAAGVLLQTRQSVRIGEEITIEGPDGESLTGTATELNSRAVLLTTPDGRTAHVPNSQMLGRTFLNNSRRGARRSEVQVRVTSSGGPDEVIAAVTQAATAVDGVHQRDAVRALVQAVSPDRVMLRLQFWHHPLKGVSVTSEVVRAVASAIVSAGWRGTVTSAPGAPPYIPSDEI